MRQPFRARVSSPHQCERGTLGIVTLVVILLLSMSNGFAQTTAPAFDLFAPCQTQDLTMPPSDLDDAARLAPVSARMVQNLRRIQCTLQDIIQDAPLEQRLPLETIRQQATHTMEDLIHALRLTAVDREKNALSAFAQAFGQFRDLTTILAADALVAQTPTARTHVRQRVQAPGRAIFDQTRFALQTLIEVLGPVEPPNGAIRANATTPTPGSTWRGRSTLHTQHTQGQLTKTWKVLEPGTYRGRSVYRVADGTIIHLYDQATHNWIAEVVRDREIVSASPYVAGFAFPLWVGKAWVATHIWHDREKRFARPRIPWRGTVTAYEEITVPAGTFKAFKVEGRDLGQTRWTAWYVPELRLRAKLILQYLPNHYLGPGTFTFELIEFNHK